MALNRKERRATAKQDRLNRTKAISPGQFAKIEQSIVLVEAGKFDEAEALLETVRRTDPNDPEVKHQLGMLYVRTGRAESGIELLRQAVAARPRESLYWKNMAAACLSIERSQEAVDAARKALEIDAGNFLGWQNLALGLRDLKDAAGAVDAFEQAAKLGSIDVSCMATWGECLGTIGRFQEAEKTTRSALEKSPEDPAVLTLLGWLLTEQKNDTEARAVFRRSLDKKPDQFIAAFNYGVLSMRADETDVGLRWLRRSTSLEPKSAAAWRVLALELAKHGLREEALPAAERTLRLAPGDDMMADLVRKLKGQDGAVPETAFTIDFEPPAPLAPGAEKPAATGNDDGPLLDLQILRIGEQP